VTLVASQHAPGDEARWHEWRRAGVGGSDAPAICGLSPWKGALTVWLEKTGRLQPQPRDREAPWLRWGRRLEGVMVDEFAELTGHHVGLCGSSHERSGTPWQRTTLDGVVFEHPLPEPPEPDGDLMAVALALLELKTSSWRSSLSWADGTPKVYQVQVQHELMVTGLQMAYLAVLHDGSRFEIHEIERDEEAIAALDEIEREFWRCVERDEPPPADSRKGTEAAVRSAFEVPSPGRVVVLDTDALARARAYVGAQARRDLAEEELTRLRADLMLRLGDAEAGTDELGNPVLTWKPYQTTRVDLDGLRNAHPEIVQEHTRRVPARRFKAALDREEEQQP
jgi:putative phage-type endonuclease